jgi:hypothetical protein
MVVFGLRRIIAGLSPSAARCAKVLRWKRLSASMADMNVDEITRSAAPRFRFRLVHVLYAMTLLGASIAVCGWPGVLLALFGLWFWHQVFWHPRSPDARPRQIVGRLFANVVLALLLLGCIAGLLLPAVRMPTGASWRAHCQSNLKQLALALHNYHDTYGSFPPPYIADETGKPLHSWRVLILPFCEQQKLYDSYRFDEPWDGPNNKKLLDTPPDFFQCYDHQRGRRDNTTSYFAIVGLNTAWSAQAPRTLRQFSDGTSNSLLLLEGPSHKIAWSEPRDLTETEAIQLLTAPPGRDDGRHADTGDFFTTYVRGRNMALADGSVHPLAPQWPRDDATALLRIDDGRILDDDRVGSLTYPSYTNWSNVYRLILLIVIALLPLPWALRTRS